LNGFDIKSYYFKVKDKDTPEEAKWITILPKGSEPTPDTVHIYEAESKKWVTILPKGSEPTPDTVHVYEAENKKWMSFREWLWDTSESKE
jgi:hypothetical protein